MVQLKTLIMCFIIISRSTGINTRITARGPAMKTLHKEPCVQDSSIKWFRKPGGTCSVCTDCSALGLRTRRACSNYRDETCYNKCIESDAVYDPVISQCVKKSLQRLTPQSTVISKKPRMEIHTTDSTPSDLKLNSRTPKSLQSKSQAAGAHYLITIFAIVIAVLVVPIVGIVGTLWVRRTKACRYNRGQTHLPGEEVMLSPLPGVERKHEMRTADKNETHACSGTPGTRLKDGRTDPAYRFQEPRNVDINMDDNISQSSHTYETINETQV